MTFDQKRRDKLAKLDELLNEYLAILSDPLCCNISSKALTDCDKKIVKVRQDIIDINNAEQC